MSPVPVDATTEAQILLRIPNTLANWPWPRTINSHYESCKAESAAWVESFQAFSPKAQKAFNKCDFSRLRPKLSDKLAY